MNRSLRDAVAAGCRQAFGEELEPVYHLENADVIVALDADFLAWGPGRLKDARAFAARREPEQAPREYILGRQSDGTPASVPMNRLYAIECTPTITGASADHRLPMAARDIAAIARAVAGAVGVGGRFRAGRDRASGSARPARAMDRCDGARPEGGRRQGAWSSRATRSRRRSTRWLT